MIENAPGVYVLRLNETVKIGSAHNMARRVKEFRGRWWRDAELIGMIPCRDVYDARRLERRLQRKYWYLAKGHELFIASPKMIKLCRRASSFIGRLHEKDPGGGLRRREAQLKRRGESSSRSNS